MQPDIKVPRPRSIHVLVFTQEENYVKDRYFSYTPTLKLLLTWSADVWQRFKILPFVYPEHWQYLRPPYKWKIQDTLNVYVTGCQVLLMVLTVYVNIYVHMYISRPPTSAVTTDQEKVLLCTCGKHWLSNYHGNSFHWIGVCCCFENIQDNC